MGPDFLFSQKKLKSFKTNVGVETFQSRRDRHSMNLVHKYVNRDVAQGQWTAGPKSIVNQ